MRTRKTLATAFAILAALLYAVNIPLSKLLVERIAPTMLAALLYLGAGAGLALYTAVSRVCCKRDKAPAAPLTKKELPYIVAMVLLDIVAPILLMLGISKTTSANVSLLNNFEIVATSLIALFVFKEVISKRLFLAIALVTLASVILGFEGEGSLEFSAGSLFVLGACVCWGFENNCTRKLSNKSSTEIVIIKGFFSGLGSLIVAFMLGERLPAATWLFAAMALGFVAYGLSINFYILAQKDLGAAKTSAYYSLAPFIGVALGMLILGERPELRFYIALAIMAVSTVIMVKDTVALQHTHAHAHVHCHAHSHGDIVHTHEHTHVHTHTHTHGSDEETHAHTHAEAALEGHEHTHGAA